MKRLTDYLAAWRAANDRRETQIAVSVILGIFIVCQAAIAFKAGSWWLSEPHNPDAASMFVQSAVFALATGLGLIWYFRK